MQQVEHSELMVIRQFIQKHGKYIVWGLLAAVILVMGFRFWNQRSINRVSNAAQIFQDMMLAEVQRDTNAATAKGEQLMAEYKGTAYSQLSALLLAKIAVQQGNLDQAAQKLRWVIDHAGSHNFALNLATVRLASVLQAQGKIDEALALVVKDPDQAYLPLFAQMRGDIYLAKGDLDKAKESYELALNNLPPGTAAPITQMQLLDLGGKANA